MTTFRVNLDELAQVILALKNNEPAIKGLEDILRWRTNELDADFIAPQRAGWDQDIAQILSDLNVAATQMEVLRTKMAKLLEEVNHADQMRTADATLFRPSFGNQGNPDKLRTPASDF